MTPEPSHAQTGHRAAAHVSPPSWWPLTMAIGVALTLTGLVINPVMLVIGVVLGVASLALWVRDARREFRELDE
jgi:Flp pilus assembly protein TadB